MRKPRNLIKFQSLWYHADWKFTNQSLYRFQACYKAKSRSSPRDQKRNKELEMWNSSICFQLGDRNKKCMHRKQRLSWHRGRRRRGKRHNNNHHWNPTERVSALQEKSHDFTHSACHGGISSCCFDHAVRVDHHNDPTCEKYREEGNSDI